MSDYNSLNLYPNNGIFNNLVKIIHDRSINIEPDKTSLQSKLPLLKEIKAVIFDIYGTLFISGSGDISTVSKKKDLLPFKNALLSAGFVLLDTNSAVKTKQLFIDGIKQAHTDSKKRGIEFPEVDIVSVWNGVISVLLEEKSIAGKKTLNALLTLSVEYESRANMVWPMPGSLELINYLHKKGITTGIVSNAQFYTPLLFPAFFGLSLSDLGYDDDLCIWSYKHGCAKPSDMLFRILLQNLDRKYSISPHQVLYVGNDMLNDICTASKNGCKTALFAGDTRSLRLRIKNKQCKGINSDIILTDLLQLKELFCRRLSLKQDGRDEN